MSEHEHYEELCAMLATGQITDDELKVLRIHLTSCTECARLAASFSRMGGEIVSERASRSTDEEMRGVRSRFLARARELGIELPTQRGKQTGWTSRHTLVPLVLAVAAVLLVAVFAKTRTSTAGGKRELSSHVASVTSSVPAVLGGVAPAPELSASLQKLEHERGELQKAIASNEARKTALEMQVSKLTGMGQQQQRDIDSLRRKISDLSSERDENALQLASALNGLEKARTELTAANVQLATQQHQLAAVTEEARLEEAKYEREKVIASAGKDGHSILAARNLHIIDVYDVNGQGKRQKAFGRIFYVEDRELVFYAYDLASVLRKDTRFYAWGSGHGESPYVARLGVLHNDGNGEGRWELRFNDGGVLARIDSVFVTAEENDAQAPKGKRLLVAVLGDQPNHP
jgi:hypothetical protein